MRKHFILRRQGRGWRRAGAALSMILLPTGAIADPGMDQKLRKLDGGSGSITEPSGSTAPSVTFAVSAGELVPGSSAEVVITTQEALPLLGGRLVMTFEPPIFLDTPSVDFHGASTDLSFGLTPLGPGSYAVDFDSPSGSLNLQPGRFMTVVGTVQQSQVVGDWVDVVLTAVATGRDGNPVSATSRGRALQLTEEPDPALTLRIDDESNLVPGSMVLVEVRTYNPKPISDGQICLRFESTAFTSVHSVTVHGDSDVAFTAETVMPGELLVQFSSPSASINRVDGPLLEVGMKLANDLPPGFETIVDVDTAFSGLVDHSGMALTLRGKSGLFTIAE